MKSLLASARLTVLTMAGAASWSVAAQSIATLSETLVTATRFAQERETLPFGVDIITADDIHASGASSVNEAVMHLLGVPGHVDFYGGANYSLDLRGFGETAVSNQVVLLDGVRLNEADLAAPRLSGIPIDTVERIEVLRGSGAVLYGEGATGGVIVITTKAGAGKERRNSASAYAGVGTNHLREWRGSVTVASGGFSLDVDGQRRDSDNHRANFRSESDASGVTAQWSNDFLRLGMRRGEDKVLTGLPGALSAEQFAIDPAQASTPTDWARIRNVRHGVFAQAILGDWELAADAGWREKTLRSAVYDYDVEARNHGLRARHESRVGGFANRFVVGHDASQWRRVAYGTNSNQSSRAWYLHDEVTLASGMRLSGGWRTERMDKDANGGADRLAGSQSAWELGLHHPLTDASRIWGRVGRSFRLANVDEFSFTNPLVAIRPQVSRDVEWGWDWGQATHKLQVRLYRSMLTDEIGYDPAAVNPNSWNGLGANVNYDPTRRQGMEFNAEWALNRSLTLGVRFNLREATFRSGPHAGKDVPLVPRESLALRAQWVPNAQHQITAGLNWVGTRFPDMANQCRMPSYTAVNARYAHERGPLEFSFAVNNLFNRGYYTLAYACAGDVPTSVYPEAGRTFVMAMRVRY